MKLILPVVLGLILQAVAVQSPPSNGLMGCPAIYPSKSLGDVIAMLRAAGARTDIRDKAGLSVFDYWDEIAKGTNTYHQWIGDSLAEK